MTSREHHFSWFARTEDDTAAQDIRDQRLCLLDSSDCATTGSSSTCWLAKGWTLPPSISMYLEGKTHFSMKIARAFHRQFTTIPVQQKEPSKGSCLLNPRFQSFDKRAPPPHGGHVSEPRLLCAPLMPSSSTWSCPPEKTFQPLCFWS